MKRIGNKKAQITLFLIIGIIIIGAGIAFFMMSGEQQQIQETEKVVQQVPKDLDPIRLYVEMCMTDLSHEAIIEIGKHGGYLDPLNPVLTENPLQANIINPTDADGVSLIPDDTSTFIPYWVYLETPNKELRYSTTSKNVLDKDGVEQQINNYVDLHLDECLAGFKDIEARGFRITPRSEHKTTSTLTDEDVMIYLEYNLEVHKGDATSNIKTFLIRQPVELKKMYELAADISMAEMGYTYLEGILNDLITGYSGLDSDLPPHFDTEDSLMKRVWIKTQVKDSLEKILRSYISLIQVNNTSGAKIIESDDPYEASFYKKLFLDILQDNYDDFDVSFYYLGWPIYFDITPNNGELLTAFESSRQEWFLFPPTERHSYEFFYDVSYPVVVEIRSKDAFNNNGFSFFFALEGNIRDDKTLREQMLGQGSIGESIPLFVMSTNDELISDQSIGEMKGITSPISPTIMCKEDQKYGSKVYIEIKDELNDEPIENLSLRFGCGELATCSIGISEINPETGVSFIEGNLPVCLNGGYLSFEQFDYEKKVIPKITSVPNTEIVGNISLKKYSVLNVSVTKVLMERKVLKNVNTKDYKGNYKSKLIPGISADISNNDMVLISIERVDDNPLISYVPQTIIFDSSMDTSEFSSLKILPGEYDITASYIDKSPSIIEKQKRCVDPIGQRNDKCFYMPDEQVEMEMRIAGGLELNNESGRWFVSEAMLKDTSQVEFKIFSTPQPIIIEDLNEMGMTENLSIDYRYLVEPIIS